MVKKTIKIVLVVLIIMAALAIVLMPTEIVAQFGEGIYAAPIIVLILALIPLFLGKVSKRSSGPINELQTHRQKINVEISEAEKRFLQHKIDKETFDRISKEKNTELIRVEAELDAQKKKGLTKEEIKKLENLGADKRKILFGLLEQRQIKVNELKIAENSMYKRRIDEETFQKISSDIKQELISIDSQIKAIQQSEQIEKLKEQLKEGAQEIAKQKKTSAVRGKEDYFEEMGDEVMEQIKQAT